MLFGYTLPTIWACSGLTPVRARPWRANWTKPFVLWLESRAAGKTTLLALFSMVKGLIFNNYRTYICSGTADQSQETFKKIEDIALKNIESMTGLTDVFKNEVEISQANSNGFIDNPMEIGRAHV